MLAVLDPEQQLLAETVQSLASTMRVAGPHDVEQVDRAKAWAALADAGLLGLRRRDGGVPLASGVESMIVAHELGAALAPVPYVAAVLAVELLELAGVGDERAEPIAVGTSHPGLLLGSSLLDVADATDERAVMIGGLTVDQGFALRRAEGGAQLVSVGTDGIEASAAGVDLTTALATRAGGVDPSAIEDVGAPIADADLQRWRALALTLTSADCAGAMRAAVDGVVEYTKVRIAYDVPIGTFQALQHMCADAFVDCEAAVTTNNYAAWAVDALDPAEALLAAHTAKAWTARVGRGVTETVTQVYGGIGHTWEHVAHLFVRRVLLDTALFGNEVHQLDAIALLRGAGVGSGS